MNTRFFTSDQAMADARRLGHERSELEQMIAHAFRTGARSDEIVATIAKAEAALNAVTESAERARTRALDPTLSPSNPALSPSVLVEARREMEETAFLRDRLQTAVTKLRERLEQVSALEEKEDRRRQPAYDNAKAERDKLAKELARVYPAFEAQLADLLQRIEANDRQIEYINGHALPRGASPLLGAELVARGLGGFADGMSNVPRITQDLRLPAFEYSKFDPYAWPRSR